MASPKPLCPQNKNQMDYTGFVKHPVNKVSETLRPKPHTVQTSKRGSENQDPNESPKLTKSVNKLKSISRLPVLAKSLHPVLTDTSQSPGHKRWEQRPVLGKAQKRKTCTKPVPFSFQSRIHSQKNTEAATESTGKSGMPLTRAPQQTASKTLTLSQHRAQNRTPTCNMASGNTHVDHTRNAKTLPFNLEGHQKLKLNSTLSVTAINKDASNEIGSSIQRDLSTQLGSITLANAESIKVSGRSLRTAGIKNQTVCQQQKKSCIQTLLSVSGTSTTGNAVEFSPDPSALSSILQNEGVKVGGPVGPTPRMSTCPAGRETSMYSAQRVPFKKPQTEGASAVPGHTGTAIPFSPDPSSLRNILLNEGIKAGCLVGATPRVSTCPSGRGTSVYSAQRVPLKKPLAEAATADPGPAGSAVAFSPDSSALRSIFQNEGLKVGATPRMSTCPSGRETSIYSAQRVPFKKPQTEAASAVPGRTGVAVQFSPDPAALRSILLNEGIKVGGPVGASPRVSVCQSGRGTSIYSAKRVPLKKVRAEEVAHTGPSRTPTTKLTPQRVPYSQSQSLRRLITAPKTPFFNDSPSLSGSQASSTDRSTQQEEDVVQRLFQEEPEQKGNEQMEEERAATAQSLEYQKTTEPLLKLEGNTDTSHLVQEKIPAVQPFIQAPHRQSVIVFSSGQRLVRPGQTHEGVLQLPDAAGQLQTSTTSAEAQSTAPVQSDQSSGSQSALNSDLNKQMTPSALCKTKASSLSSAQSILRRRLPPLEEMFLDEECATYTSCPQSWPAQPRCSNPVASTLLFQDTTCFVPIDLTYPCHSSVPQHSLPIRA